MGRIWMPGGGGGADLDMVTALADDVIQGKVIVGPDGEPLTGILALSGDAGDSMVLSGKTYYNTDPKQKRTGTMPNQGAKTAALNCGGSYTIPAGYHNGSGKVTANGLASQTGVQSGKTAAGAAQIQTGYEAWVNGGRVTGSMATMNGGTYTPSGSQQTISCSGKKMNSNIIISAIPSKYVDVTAAQTVFNNGVCRLIKRVYPYYIRSSRSGSPSSSTRYTVDESNPITYDTTNGNALLTKEKDSSGYYYLLVLDGSIRYGHFKKIKFDVSGSTFHVNSIEYVGVYGGFITGNNQTLTGIFSAQGPKGWNRQTITVDIPSTLSKDLYFLAFRVWYNGIDQWGDSFRGGACIHSVILSA